MPTLKLIDDPIFVSVPVGDPTKNQFVRCRFLSEKERDKILKSCQHKSINHTTHQSEVDYNMESIIRKTCAASIVTFENVTWKDLNELLQPDAKFEGADLNEIIPENNELAKTTFVEHGFTTVRNEIQKAAQGTFDEAIKDQEIAEKKT